MAKVLGMLMLVGVGLALPSEKESLAAPQDNCKKASWDYCCELGTPCDCSKGIDAPGQCTRYSYDFCCGVGAECDCSTPPPPGSPGSTVAAPAPPLQCGVASAVFSTNPAAAITAVETGKLSFWWNWNIDPTLDLAALQAASPATLAHLNQTFVPMIWGTGEEPTYGFLQDTSDAVMGFNEPDQYGPACCNCDGKQTYSPATSSGWAPLFNPSSGATNWQTTIGQLAAALKGAPRKIDVVSPAMAGAAVPAPGVDCSLDPAVPPHSHFCAGWLSMFKQAALKLKCTAPSGEATNCWDVIDKIQIHAYAKSPSDVLAKIASYYKEFTEDLEGANGRSKKTLWLTEVAMGSSNGTEVAKFAADLMGPTGLGNRAAAASGGYGYVERVSWFSEFSFGSFPMGGVTPQPNEAWSSTLFNPFGGLSEVGEAFFSDACQTVGRR